jgi:hypothetical protein
MFIDSDFISLCYYPVVLSGMESSNGNSKKPERKRRQITAQGLHPSRSSIRSFETMKSPTCSKPAVGGNEMKKEKRMK